MQTHLCHHQVPHRLLDQVYRSDRFLEPASTRQPHPSRSLQYAARPCESILRRTVTLQMPLSLSLSFTPHPVKQQSDIGPRVLSTPSMLHIPLPILRDAVFTQQHVVRDKGSSTRKRGRTLVEYPKVKCPIGRPLNQTLLVQSLETLLNF